MSMLCFLIEEISTGLTFELFRWPTATPINVLLVIIIIIIIITIIIIIIIIIIGFSFVICFLLNTNAFSSL